MITVIVWAYSVVYGILRRYIVVMHKYSIVGMAWMYGRDRAVRACMM